MSRYLSENIDLRLAPQMLRDLKVLAEEHDRSVSWMIRHACAELIEREHQAAKA
jgi:predicted transcriptional regulator